MILKMSEVNLVFIHHNDKSVECFQKIVQHIIQDRCHDFSVSHDHVDGVDIIQLSIDFVCADNLLCLSKIILEYEEEFYEPT